MRLGGMRGAAALCAAALLVGCGGGSPFGSGGRERAALQETPLTQRAAQREAGTILDLFNDRDDPNVTLEVNRYLWAASLDVLSFMPVEQADPFSGIIQFGYGLPPGGGQAYQATVYVQDPALDARSLNVALRTRSGAVDRATLRAVEDAILTRARQLRVADGRL